jgi:NifU-like protein involved in Fe-S cluster formation
MYSAKLLDHFQNPRNAGEIETPDASVQLENPACGDVLKLTAKVVDGRIVDIRFKAMGCVATMGCGSALTEVVKGKTLREAAQLTKEEIATAVGGLPEASGHAADLARNALAAALKQLAQR